MTKFPAFSLHAKKTTQNRKNGRGYFTSTQKKLAAVLSPLLVIGVMSAGIIAPAAATTPPSSSAPSDDSEVCATDNFVTTYVGGDFVDVAASEIEGVTVFASNAEINTMKAIGWLGLNAGTDRNSTPGDRVLSVGDDLQVNTSIDVNATAAKDDGTVVVSGTITTPENIHAYSVDQHQTKEKALALYSQFPNNFVNESARLSELKTSGVVSDDGYKNITFTGNGDATKDQVFNLTADEAASISDGAAVVFKDVPKPSIIVINVPGTSPTVKLANVFLNSTDSENSASGPNASAMVDLAPRTIWNFADATGTVNLLGQSQLPGSILVPNSSTTTNVGTSLNGRVYVNGDMNFGAKAGGVEIHSFPFDDTFDCVPTPPVETPTGSLSVAKVFSGDNAAEAPQNGQYGGTYDCTVDGSSVAKGAWSRKAGEEPQVFSGIPVDATCTVTETDKAALPTHFSWNEPVISGQVTIHEGEISAVVVTNTIADNTPNPTLTLVKVVDNGDTNATWGPQDWTLSALSADNVQKAVSGNGKNGVKDHTVLPGTYALSEAANADQSGYTAASTWLCTNNGASLTVAKGNTITLNRGDNVQCQITNTAQISTLTLKKEVRNENGGTAKNTDWALHAGKVLNGATGVNSQVPVGAYTLSETDGPTGYTQTSLTCSNSGDAQVSSVTVGLGENITCTFVNTDEAATLTLHKVVLDNGTKTSHTPSDWTLTATPVEKGSAGNQKAVSGNGKDGVKNVPINAGNYKLAESHIAGFTAKDWTCVDADGVTLNGKTLTVANGASADCTITNKAKAPKLTLKKGVVNEHGGTATADDWTLSASGPFSSASGTTGAPSVTNAKLPVGAYTLTEQGQSATAYTWTHLTCTAGSKTLLDTDDPAKKAQVVNLSLGTDVTCVYTNTDKPATVTLKKIVDDNGTNSTGQPSDWTLTATPTESNSGASTVSGSGDPEANGGVNKAPINAGSYTLSEQGPAGYTVGKWQCAGAVGQVSDDAVVTIPNGADVECQITNTATFPHLTLVKKVNNGHGVGSAEATDWVLTADGASTGASTISGTVGSAEVTGAIVKSGTYTLSEFGTPIGYTSGNWECTGAANDGDTITLDSGQDAVCTIVNTAQPGTWTVSKTSDPASGSTVQPGDLVTYTVTSTHTGGAIPANTVVTDNLSDVLDDATLVGTATTEQGSAALSGNTLTWNTGSFTGTASLHYMVKVNSDAYGVTLKNVVTPPSGGVCDDTDCTTTNVTPHWTILKTSDPASGSVVEPGSIVTYTLTAHNDSDAAVVQAHAYDDLSDVLSNATLVDIQAPGLSFDADAKRLVWAIPTMAAGSDDVTVNYQVRIDPDAFGHVIRNIVTQDNPGGNCPPEVLAGYVANWSSTDDFAAQENTENVYEDCRTTHRAQDVDLSIHKSHTLTKGDAVDSDKGSVIDYTLTVENKGKDPATNVVATDKLPVGLSLVARSEILPEGWTLIEKSGTLTLTHLGVFAAGTKAELTFTTEVGTLKRSGADVPFSNIVNTACVKGAETDSNKDDNCSTDSTKVKSIAVTAHAVCSNDAPLMSYSLTPYNLTSPPTIAMIWWTPEGYKNRDASIPPTDESELLGDGAEKVDYITVPTDWSNGKTISGKILWPGAAVNKDGKPVSWPGWTQLDSGQWVLNPAAPFYDLRGEAVVEIRINPTTASTQLYPPASPNCNASPPKFVAPPAMAKTGSSVYGPFGLGALLIMLGGSFLFWMRRRRTVKR